MTGSSTSGEAQQSPGPNRRLAHVTNTMGVADQDFTAAALKVLAAFTNSLA